MIRTLSPYNYIIPFKSVDFQLICQKYVLQLFIWDGELSNVPTEPTISFTKRNPQALGDNGEVDVIDASSVLADYIDTVLEVPVQRTDILDGNAQLWVKSQVLYYTTPSTPDSFEPPAYITTSLFGRGYSYGLEGENVIDTPDNILLTGREFKVYRGGIFVLPIYTPNNTVPSISVNSFPDGDINETPTKTIQDNKSREATQYLWLDVSQALTDTSIAIVIDGVEVSLIVEDEYKYTPIDILFMNKFGVLQSITFFKEFKSEMNVKNKTYQSSDGQPIDGRHQFKTINAQGREGFNVQSGWVDEEMNDTFKQLLLSDEVWQYKDSSFIPLNVKSKTISYKTQTIDRLIQYDIDFEYSFNAINNI